jgi:uncharacterized protein (TIGR02270 family)
MERYKGYSTQEISSLVNAEVVKQHFEDAAFHWLLRNSAMEGAAYRLTDLADTDEKVDANLEGLSLAGEVGWRLSEEKLDAPDPWELFVAAVMAFDSQDNKKLNRLYEIALPDQSLEQALTSALGWLPYAVVRNTIASFIISMKPAMRRLGIAGGAVHRMSSKQALLTAMNDSDYRTRARAIKAAGEHGFVDLVPGFIGHLEDEDDACRYYTAWSAALLGCTTELILSELQQVAMSGSKYAVTALKTAVLSMQKHHAKAWYRDLLCEPSGKHLAVIAAGVIGSPSLIPELIDFMANAELSRVSGEAFALITGVDLKLADLEEEEPEKEKLAFDDDLEDDPDEDVPYPDAAAVSKWWDEHEREFEPGKCYLLGQALSTDAIKNALLNGYQRQRQVAAMTLAIRNPTFPLFEIRENGKAQLRKLKK